MDNGKAAWGAKNHRIVGNPMTQERIVKDERSFLDKGAAATQDPAARVAGRFAAPRLAPEDKVNDSVKSLLRVRIQNAQRRKRALEGIERQQHDLHGQGLLGVDAGVSAA